VKLGSTLTFTNLDTGIDAWHTSPAVPIRASEETGADFPVSDGTTSTGRSVDLDSGQLGYGVPGISGVRNNAQWSVNVNSSDGYQPGEIVTFFCRVHPGMRGVFRVVQ